MPKSKKQPWLRQAQSSSLQAQIQQLRNELRAYENLKCGRTKISSLDILMVVPELLIKKRIANGWTQQDFASRLGLHYQQIQRYENTDYATATLETLQKAAAILSQSHI